MTTITNGLCLNTTNAALRSHLVCDICAQIFTDAVFIGGCWVCKECYENEPGQEPSEALSPLETAPVL